MEFKVGDVVRLKAHDLDMVVTALFDRAVYCTWLDTELHMATGAFPPETLELAFDEDGFYEEELTDLELDMLADELYGRDAPEGN